MSINFGGKVVIITGAGGGLGKVYALAFAERGASVVVNDLGVTRSGTGSGTKAADVVVAEIVAKGGKAVANYDSVVEDGHKIVEQAVAVFGRIDIVINNAGILRDTTLARMTDADWDLVQAVHLRGSYKVTRAAWEHFRKQGYGRVINTASAAGIYGNYGQSNYGSAKLALHGFSMSLAREGAKYNITANTIAPLAASRMTESVLPPELLENLKPELVAPLVMFLTSDTCKESGSIFEVGAGYVGKLRYERSNGAIFKTDASFGPGNVHEKWAEINDFSKPQYPSSIMEVDWMGILEKAKSLPANPQGKKPLRFDGKVVIISGAGGGLGRAYALLFGKLGASVVVNDLGTVKTASGSARAADLVVGEIKKLGGKAVANYESVEEGDKLVETAIKAFGRVDIIVNNAGILRDGSFHKMDDKDWDLVYRIHLRGTYKLTKAAWPHFVKQKYGRVINTASAVGLYGNFGQCNYSAAKSGIIGFSNTIALEGKKYNILVNTIAPNAGTSMTATVMPAEMVEALKPDYVAPLVAFLGHEANETTSAIFEVGSGWVSRVRWQRTGGYGFPVNVPLTPDDIQRKWKEITNFDDGRAEYPTSTQDSFKAVMDNMSNRKAIDAAKKAAGSGLSPKYPSVLGQKFSYTERDVILYNLGVGAKREDLDLVYENNDKFMALPSFGVVPPFAAMMNFPMADVVGQFNPMMLLHGEQFLQIHRPFPTSGTLVSDATVVDVLDKGKGVVLVLGVTTKDAQGNVVCYNEYSNFIRGVSGVGSKTSTRSGAAVAANEPPKRAPDAVVKEKTSTEHAALYRLSGDLNPLHIDPEMSAMGGFKVPILHGLCSFGIATKHVFRTFCKGDVALMKSVKVRFANPVYPGETLQTEMWKEGGRVVFQVRIVERDKLVIINGAVELSGASTPSAAASAPARKASGGSLASVDGFAASNLFQQIAASFAASSAAERQQKVKSTKAVFQFNITAVDKRQQFWFIDLKNGDGSVGVGGAPSPDATISIADADFVDLAMGKLNAQKAFMVGKIKVKGQVMLATKLDGVLKDSLKRAKM